MTSKPAPAPRRRAPVRASAAQGGAPAQERALRLQGTQTLQRLLDAGRYVFDKRGFQAARVDDVVKRAKTSHGTFYLYFSNKEDLFGALARETIKEMGEVVGALPDLTADEAGREVLQQWMSRYYDVYDRNRTVIRGWSEGGIIDSHLGRVGHDLFLRLSSALADQIKAGRPGSVDPDAAGLALLAMMERTLFFISQGSVPIDRETAIETLTTLIFDSVFRETTAVGPVRRLRRA